MFSILKACNTWVLMEFKSLSLTLGRLRHFFLSCRPMNHVIERRYKLWTSKNIGKVIMLILLCYHSAEKVESYSKFGQSSWQDDFHPTSSEIRREFSSSMLNLLLTSNMIDDKPDTWIERSMKCLVGDQHISDLFILHSSINLNKDGRIVLGSLYI